MQKMLDWEELKRECSGCRNCSLGKTRTNIVIGRGNIDAPMMLVGEGPGEQEDREGLPFVGAAGKLLDLLLDGLMIGRDKYYIANVVKCRPPGKLKLETINIRIDTLTVKQEEYLNSYLV